MAAPTSREEVKDYIMRRLGAPVINVDVAEEQVDDRIDDALALFYEQHYDGSEKYYLKHQVTDDDKANGYITIPDNIVGAIDVFPLYGSGGRVGNIFDIQYQIALNDLYNLTTVSLIPYVITMTHLNVINELLIGKVPMVYSKTKNRIYLQTDWTQIPTGGWLLFDCYQVVDPEEFNDVYKDRWFLAYATALVKKQWGLHLGKLANVQLAGGVSVNGQWIYDTAQAELDRLEEELVERYKMPPLDFLA
jgi:hypothetical protein